MGLAYTKLMTNTENRIDKAIADVELLNKTGRQKAYEVIDVFRHLESSIVALKSEREFLKNQLEKLETQTYSSHSSKGRRVTYYEADTQTETDGDLNLSILIDSVRSRNEELERENFKLNEKLKQEGGYSGKIVSKLVCQALLSPTSNDKNFPDDTDEHNIQNIQSEFEGILGDNDILTQETQKIAIQINQEKKDHEKTKNKIKELDRRCRTLQEQLEKSGKDFDKIRQENKELQKKSKKDEETINLLKNDLRDKHNKIHEQENRAQELNRQLEQGKTLKCELSLYEVNFQNEKIKTKDLENKVLHLEEQISDLKLRNKKLETDLEINETTSTQEKVNLQNKLVEQSKDYASLIEMCESLEKEKETLSQMKKHLSFHSVLRQPQSDQAVSGILSLLRAEMPNSHLEDIHESERNKDNPLLVVLYNLSNLITEAKTAFDDIEAAPNVALVVLHSKAVKKPSKQIITEPDFKQLGIIVDMSFLSSKGIISNELTDDAIQQLVEFLNKF